MAKDMKNEELQKYIEDAQLVFVINFENNTQNITVKDGVSVQDLLMAPFRLAVHIKDLLDNNERQTGQVVEEAEKAETAGA